VREDFQQEMGLYGNYLIQTPEERAAKEQYINSEQILMLDDLFLDEEGEMIPFDQEKGTRVVMGRFGNTPIINGNTEYTIQLKK
jgi:co-chaperonin GroES (HSP10)